MQLDDGVDDDGRDRDSLTLRKMRMGDILQAAFGGGGLYRGFAGKCPVQ